MARPPFGGKCADANFLVGVQRSDVAPLLILAAIRAVLKLNKIQLALFHQRQIRPGWPGNVRKDIDRPAAEPCVHRQDQHAHRVIAVLRPAALMQADDPFPVTFDRFPAPDPAYVLPILRKLQADQRGGERLFQNQGLLYQETALYQFRQRRLDGVRAHAHFFRGGDPPVNLQVGRQPKERFTLMATRKPQQNPAKRHRQRPVDRAVGTVTASHLYAPDEVPVPDLFRNGTTRRVLYDAWPVMAALLHHMALTGCSLTRELAHIAIPGSTARLTRPILT